ncbi:MAG: DUF2341 domain-containing protein, partial [Thermoplasmatota archaeon]
MVKLRPAIVLSLALLWLVPLQFSGVHSGTVPAPAQAPPKGDEPWWNIDWAFRKPVTIDNKKGSADLSDFPILLNVSYDPDMRRDFGDLRFVQNTSAGLRPLACWYESVEEGKVARVWVNVSELKAAQTTTIQMYFGNPTAIYTGDPEDIFIFYEDFEGASLDPGIWNEFHYADSATSASVSGGMLDFNVLTTSAHTGGCVISKFTLPDGDFGIETKVKFTDYYQSAFGAYAGFTDAVSYDDSYYGRPTKLVSARLWDYTKNNQYLTISADDIPGVSGNTAITIRNVWFKMRTLYVTGTWARGIWTQLESPYSEQSLEVSGSNGITPKHITCGVGDYQTAEHTYFDYVFVYKYSRPEPTCSIGGKERPFKFLSFDCESKELSENDVLNLTARIDNPTAIAIPIDISFRVGEDFNLASIIDERSLELQPSMVNEVNATWIASGGTSTLWFGINGLPVASLNVSVNRYPVLSPIMDQVLSEDKAFKLLL